MPVISCPQPGLRCEDDQRLADRAVHLAAEQVEVLRCGRCVADLDVVLGGEVHEALDARRAVLGPLAFVAVRQEHHETGGLVPLVLARHDELVDDDLGAVHEITELRLPDHECIGIRH